MADKDTQYGISKVFSDINKAAAVRLKQRSVSKTARKEGLAKELGAIGDFFASRPTAAAKPKATAKKVTYSTAKPANMTGSPDSYEARQRINKELNGAYDNYIPGTPEDSRQSLVDQLLGALGGLGGGGGGATMGPSSYARMSELLSSRAPGDRARLDALYKQYAEQIAAREADIQSQYDTAKGGYTSAYDTGVGNINAGYDAAREAQTKQLQALGLTEFAPSDLGGQQAFETGNLEKLRSAVLAQNELRRTGAISNNLAAREAAQREGVASGTAFDRRISDTLAQLAGQDADYQNQAAAAAAEAANSQAMALARLQQSAILGASKQELTSQVEAEKIALQQAKLAQDAQLAAARNAPVDVIGIYNDLVSKGTDPQVASKLAASQASNM